MVSTVHVTPVGDLIEHETGADEPGCVCGPETVPIELSGGMVAWAIVHASLDGREHDEGD